MCCYEFAKQREVRQMEKHYHLGHPPVKCELTDRPITDTFIDGRTINGNWCYMHPDTHASRGIGLGIGKGQKFEKQQDGRWLKTNYD